ncbi:5-oxoproline transporter, DUF969 family subunit [Roseiterribacter gracilis]|uniref:Membrane protein n=1 Tax=Roseiterribacter gracilis TaxID=2812848 RepID=A0A8S8XDB8_9PROT|nr:membrane protein [Rhodospirillales bacterium TMPK1]
MIFFTAVAVLLLGTLLRFNMAITVTAAALTAGAVAGLGPAELLSAIGAAFAKYRYLSLTFLVLPFVGLLERNGVRDAARETVARLQGATLDRILISYLFLRQATAAVGLLALGGHAQMVRPVVAPMVEAAAEHGRTALTDDERQKVRAFASATDNVGAFFGEDLFLAMGSVLLIRAVFAQSGIALEPLQIAVWAAPTAIVAFIVHALRLRRFAQRLRAQ